MRKFLKQLQKGLRTACVTAALATCWNIGQSVAHAGYSYGDEVTVQFSGTISPTINDLSHVYLIYGTGSSGIRSDLNVIGLGDFSMSGDGSFSVQGIAEYDDEMYWFVAGLYGDISSGQYTEGVNGVTLGVYYNPDWSHRDDWSDFIDVSEATMFTYLHNGDIVNLSVNRYIWQSSIFEMNDSVYLYNFSEVTANGNVEIQSQIVPEPITVLLFGSGGVVVLCRKRREEQGD